MCIKSEAIVIILPIPAKVLQPNCTIASLGGRMMKASAIKRYRRLAREAVEAENVASAPWRVVVVQAEFHYQVSRERDEDNAMGALKSAYDGIVDSGLVPKDNSEHMRRTIPKFIIDKTEPCVILTITRIK
jgi:hypothetical protein